MFLQDRAIHGLRNTVKQFSGKWPFCQPGTIDEFLNRTWDKWDLIRVIYAYGRYLHEFGEFPEPEFEGERYAFPLLFKAFGVPYTYPAFELAHYIGDKGKTACGWEGATSLPDNIVNVLKSGEYGNVVIGYGNIFCLFSCVDGLEKDLEEGAQHPNVEPYLAHAEIYQVIRPHHILPEFARKIYLWKK